MVSKKDIPDIERLLVSKLFADHLEELYSLKDEVAEFMQTTGLK